LTAKSIRARVKKMQTDGVISNFVVKVNLRVLDYSRFCLLTVRFDKSDDDRNTVYSLNLVGDIIGLLDGGGNICQQSRLQSKEFEEKLDLLIDRLGQN
jgi:DNA-binding Lrp family transcriptional regulator